MKISNKTYDLIKLISLIAAPLIVFLSAIVSIWDVPYCAQITATLAALDTLIGAITVALQKSYNKQHTLTEVDLDDIADNTEEQSADI